MNRLTVFPIRILVVAATTLTFFATAAGAQQPVTPEPVAPSTQPSTVPSSVEPAAAVPPAAVPPAAVPPAPVPAVAVPAATASASPAAAPAADNVGIPLPGTLLPDAPPPVSTRRALATTPVSTAPYGRYLIQPSDTVAISYRYSPEYDFVGPVQPDGFIIPPLLGEVMVMGLTVGEVHERVLERARVRLRDPEVVVVLKDFQRPSFAVGGQVEKPGRFELRGRIGVLEALAIAGGLKVSAKHSQVVLFRRYDAEHVISRVLDVKEMEKHASNLQNIELQAGDLLMVPKSNMSKVERFIPYVTLGLLNPYIWR